MSHTAREATKKRFRVIATILYHERVGVFEAESAEQALRIAEGSHRWGVISDRSVGGIYDAYAEALPDDLVTGAKP